MAEKEAVLDSKGRIILGLQRQIAEGSTSQADDLRGLREELARAGEALEAAETEKRELRRQREEGERQLRKEVKGRELRVSALELEVQTIKDSWAQHESEREASESRLRQRVLEVEREAKAGGSLGRQLAQAREQLLEAERSLGEERDRGQELSDKVSELTEELARVRAQGS